LNFCHNRGHDGERYLELVAKQLVLEGLLVADGAQNLLDGLAMDKKEARHLAQLLDLIHWLLDFLARELGQAEFFAKSDAAQRKGPQFEVADVLKLRLQKSLFV
jgi:hypothetical protein